MKNSSLPTDSHFRQGNGQGVRFLAINCGAISPNLIVQQQANTLATRQIVPVGPEGQQELIRFTRREQKIDRMSLGPVAFVPLPDAIMCTTVVGCTCEVQR